MTALDGDQLTGIVLGVEGVVDAFPPPSLPQSIAVGVGVGDLDAPRPLAATRDGQRIEARIATRTNGRSADVARAVGDALAARYVDPDVEILVQVARIH